MIPVLAHGALGIFDELLMGAVGLIFVGFMLVGFWKSRSFEPEIEEIDRSTPSE